MIYNFEETGLVLFKPEDDGCLVKQFVDGYRINSRKSSAAVWSASVAHGFSMVIVLKPQENYVSIYFEFHNGKFIRVPRLMFNKCNFFKNFISCVLYVKACNCSLFVDCEWQSLVDFDTSLIDYFTDN